MFSLLPFTIYLSSCSTLFSSLSPPHFLSSPPLTSPSLLFSHHHLSPPFLSSPLSSRRQCCMLCAEFSPRSPWASMKSRKYDWDTWHEHTNSLSHTTGTIFLLETYFFLLFFHHFLFLILFLLDFLLSSLLSLLIST